MTLTGQQLQRFQNALDFIALSDPPVKQGIGTEKEKTLHAVLKHYMDPEPSHQEVSVHGYIADLFDGNRITEIQTGSFAPMRPKLSALLGEYQSTIVHPIPAEKWISWIDPETGEITKRNKSTVTGTFYHAFRELYQIRPFLQEHNLSIDLLLIDMEEYRIQDGWSEDRKKGSHRFERIPVRLTDELLLEKPEDYRAFLPESLSEPFTSAEFMKAASPRKIRTVSASSVMRILEEQGILEETGKQGNRILWSIRRS
ncbi:MAG: hypothetical protein ACI4WR_08690 [Bulleidia sp.]